MIFYLQNGAPERKDDGPIDEHCFLDSYLHKGCELVEKVEADDWLAARDKVIWSGGAV